MHILVDLAADYVSGRPRPDDDASEARWVTSEELYMLPTSQTTKDILRQVGDFSRTQSSDHD